MSNEVETQGIVLQRAGDESPSVYTTIPNIVSIDGPGGSASEIDVTNLSSSAKEFKIGLKDEGTIGVEMNYDPTNAQHTGLLTDRDNRTLRSFKVVLTDSGAEVWSFQAYVQEARLSVQPDSVTKLNATLRISGPVTRS